MMKREKVRERDCCGEEGGESEGKTLQDGVKTTGRTLELDRKQLAEVVSASD